MSNIIADALGGLASKALGFSGGSGGGNQTVSDALKLYGQLQGNADYMGALESMAPSNPQIAKALELVKQNGGDTSKAFYSLIGKTGIDPNMVLNMLKKGH